MSLNEEQPMKLIYVASPLRASARKSQEQHEALAERLCHEVALAGHAPFAPHLLYTRFLNDSVPAERAAGIACGSAWLAVCDEVWVYTALGVSEGMRAEVALAKALGRKVVYPAGWDT